MPPLILSLPLNLYVCITVKRMDQSTCPEKSTAVSSAPVQKLGIIPNQSLELKPACQTPEKTNEPSHKIKEGEVKLPDKWAPQIQWMHVLIFFNYCFNFFFFFLGVLILGIFALFSDIRTYRSSLIVWFVHLGCSLCVKNCLLSKISLLRWKFLLKGN